MPQLQVERVAAAPLVVPDAHAPARRDPALPTIIEFAGVTGAGKTSVARRLITEFRDQGRKCGDRQMLGPVTAGRIAYSIGKVRSYVGDPRPLLQALRAALSARPRSPTNVRHALRLAAWSYRLRIAAMHDLDLILLDQGPVQEAWSTLWIARTWDEPAVTAALRAIVGRVAQRTLLVHFDLDARTARARIERRLPGGSRIDRMDRAVQLELLTRQRRVLTRLVQLAGETLGLRCHRVDAARSLDAVCADVRNAIACAGERGSDPL